MAGAPRPGLRRRGTASTLSSRPLLLAALLAALPTRAEATRPPPDWVEYHADRAATEAWLLLARGRLDAAETRAREALALRPADAAAWTAVTRVAVSRGDWASAQDAATHLLAHHPEHVEGLELSARAAVERNDAAGAREAYERLRALVPDAPAPLVGLALVAARLDHNPDDAIAWLRRAAVAGDHALTTLLLRPGWEPLREDEAFVNALNALLAELEDSR